MKGRLKVCCTLKNDLLNVLRENNIPCDRYGTVKEAVQKANDKDGVLVLADGYPEKTTKISSLLLKLAKKKKLRLYIEYPSRLPGLKFGKPRKADVERAVIATDFFGRSLSPMRILSISGLYFTPVSATRPHVVAARVAGFDTAVFGLPKETFPILFEPRPGELLVATGQLSRFLTGRYAPQDAWQTLWHRILCWLLPANSIPKLHWTPMVKPSYGAKQHLPSNTEITAVERGADWFLRSKLLLHPSRLRDFKAALKKTGNDSLLQTPPPDAPVGDGSLGIMEAPLSIIQPDGSQLQSIALRGDCHGESAMALAFGSRLSGQSGKAKIAKNLLDYWYFKSDVCKKERGNPRHSAYGLIAWGTGSPNLYTANYGDDNARLLMGTMATAALLNESRWDKLMMRCLLANLRTTGKLGFRGDRIDIPELSTTPWQTYFNRKTVSYCPHMEAYLWACYLWAYKQTGCKLFYERAQNALRMTMEVYTDGWRWMNGLAQEKARIILPLAWLVRIKNTRQHRQWLMEAIKGLQELQDPCGAIREELGLPGKGWYPPPASNEAYGTNEASLIQKNGDPVSDMLYTANFAFLGLHEAACATNDPAIRKMENKLAEFLCRIQVRSDAQPSLDGGWFRAFDFKRWEAWGANADAGWGAWAIESGWTQAWITSVLAMRCMKTSLWDLTAKSHISRHAKKLISEMGLKQ